MITPEHLQEWLDSAVDEGIINLNVSSLEGPAAYEHLLYSDKLERLNTGILTSSVRNRYSFLEDGGWWCNGVDPLNNWEPMLWGCLKPCRPRLGFEKGKPIKYEHPPKEQTRVFLLLVPDHIWERVSDRCGIPIADEDKARGFWHWVWKYNVPIVITEGCKKSGALLTAGLAAIALPGIYGGYRTPKDEHGSKTGKASLILDLQHFATLKREVSICFDHDLKQQTIHNVNIAVSQLGRLFEAEGCKVKVVCLPGPQKGADDLIFARGVDAFSQIYDDALPLATWQIRLLRQLSYEPDVVVSTKYLGDINIPGDAKLVVLKAPKGSGKTEVISELCHRAYKSEQPVIVLTYREQLGRELARRFKLPYKTEIWDTPEGKLYGFALCIDSAHPRSEAKFIGESWANALVVIDESESVIWHTLNSATATKNRIPILHELQALFAGALSSASGGQVILADADLSDLSISFVKGLAGQPDLKPYVVTSDYKPEQGWDVASYETPVDLYSSLTASLSQGRHIVFTGGQRVTSKWGSQNLEKALQEDFPKLRILRVDRETVGDPRHAAYGCIDQLNAVLADYDVVIASPVIESGVSIDLHDHFAGEWAFFPGVIATDSVRQTLARVRDVNVPRHLWATPRGLATSFVGNGATSPAALRNGELKKSRIAFQLLLEAGVTVDADGSVNTNAIALETWLKMASRINAGFHDYRNTILTDLEAEGHSVTRLGLLLDAEGGKLLSEAMADSRDELAQREAELISEAMPSQTETEYKKLKTQKSKTPDERRSQNNYELLQRYAAPPTPELVLKDWDGWHPHLRMHYYLTVGSQYLSERDGKRFEGIAHNARSWIPDCNRVLLSSKVKALQVLGIEKLFVPGVDWSQDSPEVQEIAQKALSCASDIKLFLGVTVTPKNEPMAIVQEILSQALGFRLQQPPKGEPQFIEKGVDAKGKRQRIRIYNFVHPKDRGEVFERWLIRDAEAAARKTVSSPEQMDHQNPVDIYQDFSDPSSRVTEFSRVTEQETVSSPEQMDHQTPKDIYKGFSDPNFSDPSSKALENSPVNEEGEKGPGEEQIRPAPQPTPQEGALNIGNIVHYWGRGAARYVVESFVDSVIVKLTSLATGQTFTSFRSMLTPVLEGAP